jgi:hypothetical protein
VPRGGLPQVCSRRHGRLQGAWRGQAVPALGLPKGSSDRRHAPLQGTRRRQALPARGLLQVRSRRHGALRGARRRQALPALGLPKGSSDRRHAPLHRARRGQAVPPGRLHQGSRSSSWQHALHALSPARAAQRYVGELFALQVPETPATCSPASHATAELEEIAQTPQQFLACRAGDCRCSGDATPTETQYRL